MIRHNFRLIFISALFSLLSSSTSVLAQPLILTQVQKLIGMDSADFDGFGYAVAVDGNTALIGAPGADGAMSDSSSGAAYVFVRDDSGIWVEQAELTAEVPVPSELFGRHVAISKNTALVGGFVDSRNGSVNPVHVFTRDALGNWSETANLVPAFATNVETLEYAVAIDGDTALIGVSRDTVDGVRTGSAYLFTRNDTGVWSDSTRITASDAVAEEGFGRSVSLDGDIALIGATGNHVNGPYSGAAYVFRRNSNGAWSEQAKLTPSDGAEDDEFGIAVDVDDGTAVIGAHRDETNSGSAYVFTSVNGRWQEQAKLVDTEGSSFAFFGRSVAIDRDVVLVGAARKYIPPFAQTGAVLVFTRAADGLWNEQSKLVAGDSYANARFGFSVGFDGQTALVGLDFYEGDPSGSTKGYGAAYVFSVANDSDGDSDGVIDAEDNCPIDYNPAQEDADKDFVGDACDEDDDNDGIIDDTDNCPVDSNDDQNDFDRDSLGDVCDDDSDGDVVLDVDDHCLWTRLGERPTKNTTKNRYYADANGEFVDGRSRKAGITIADTGGCSGQQIVVELGLGNGHIKHGITLPHLKRWVASHH